jgi:hypothetical protein
MKQLPAHVDGVGDCGRMLIKLSRRDRVEQPTIGILRSCVWNYSIARSHPNLRRCGGRLSRVVSGLKRGRPLADGRHA